MYLDNCNMHIEKISAYYFLFLISIYIIYNILQFSDIILFSQVYYFK